MGHPARTWTEPATTLLLAPQQAPVADLRFRALMPRGQWDALPAATRRRFGRRLGPGEAIVYRGVTERTRTNVVGRLLARAGRLIGAPLPLPGVADGGAAVVTVTEAEGGQFWTRQYARAGRFPQIVHSAKGFGGPTGLEEVVGGGVGMALTIRARGGVLLFEEAGYFVRLRGRRVPLPRAVLPRLTVGHEDLAPTHGEGAFAFTLTLTHPLCGTLMDQRCVFTETCRAAQGDQA